MTQLIIGASGLIGTHLHRNLQQKGAEVFASYRIHQIPNAFRLDVTKAGDVRKSMQALKSRIIYLSAALSNVDYCELHPEEAYQINVTGLQNIVQTSNEIDAKLIYFSTDYIFDGKNGPYSEYDTANPISQYGLQKMAAEHYIALFSHRYVIIRTTVVYGWEFQGKNFITRLIALLKEDRPIKTPVDQISSPTFANNLAELSVQLAQSDFNGTINITGPDCISRYEFARTAAEIFGLNQELVVPISTSELNQPAKRPLKAGLKTEKISKLLPLTPLANFYTGLTMMYGNPLI